MKRDNQHGIGWIKPVRDTFGLRLSGHHLPVPDRSCSVGIFDFTHLKPFGSGEDLGGDNSHDFNTAIST
jgi:hypothetical protein